MGKLFLLLTGFGAGVGGTAAWLLSEPGPVTGQVTAPLRAALGERGDALKTRFMVARAEGQRAGAETRARLQSKLDLYRQNPSRTAFS